MSAHVIVEYLSQAYIGGYSHIFATTIKPTELQLHFCHQKATALVACIQIQDRSLYLPESQTDSTKKEVDTKGKLLEFSYQISHKSIIYLYNDLCLFERTAVQAQNHNSILSLSSGRSKALNA